MSEHCLYGIKACDTMKKARSWLDEHGVAYRFHDYKTAGIDRARLEKWCDEHGWDKVLNRAGTTFRMAFFVAGPFKKFALTAGMLFVGAVVDSMIPNVPLIPDTPVFIAVATFVGVTTCLDVARKYGQLTGSRLIVWLEQRLGRVIKTDDEP